MSSDINMYLNQSIKTLIQEQRQLQSALDLSTLVKLIEMGRYPVEILDRYPNLLKTFENRLNL